MYCNLLWQCSYTVVLRSNGTAGKYDQNWLWKINLHRLSVWSFIQKIAKNQTFHWSKRIESRGMGGSRYEINVFLQNTLATIIGTPGVFYD